MKKQAQLEFWLRGPVPGIPALLQPAAHALLQAREEVNGMLEGFPEDRLWERPAGVASVGFHLRHLTGVLDRLLTYARGEGLGPEQLDYLRGEGTPGSGADLGGNAGSGEGAGVDAGSDEGSGVDPGVNVGSGAGSGVAADTVEGLVDRFNKQIDKALEQISKTPDDLLTALRGVGRDRIPSTVGGLLFHAAEHTQRHVGQLLVTVRVLRPSGEG